MKRKTPNKIKGQIFEDKVKKTINSGACWFDKGDLKDSDYIIDTKITDKKSYRITSKTVRKLWDDALDANKLPKLIIGIEDDDCRWLLEVKIAKEAK